VNNWNCYGLPSLLPIVLGERHRPDAYGRGSTDDESMKKIGAALETLNTKVTISRIEEIRNLKTRPVGTMKGSNGSDPGTMQMLNFLSGHSSMDGYRVTTSKTEILVLIDNAQSCCEDWGYITSEDDFSPYIGSELRWVRLTNTALNSEYVERSCRYGFDNGGIQFVDFETNKGVFQLAVYNAHNGYYGHGIVVTIGSDAICEDTL
jgi:hypothetical protein